MAESIRWGTGPGTRGALTIPPVAVGLAAPSPVTGRPAAGRCSGEPRKHGRVHGPRRGVRGGDPDRLRRRQVAPGRGPDAPERVGTRRTRVRHVHQLVPARRRHLHRVHADRGPRARLCGRRGGVLRAGLPDRGLSDRLHLRPAALVGCPRARLRHARRVRPGPLRLAGPRARGHVHRHPGHDAVHRAAARRHRVGADRAWSRRLEHRAPERSATYRRVHSPRRVYVSGRAAGAGADRVRERHAYLGDGHRRDPVHPGEARRLGAHLRRRVGAPEDDQPGDRQAARRPQPCRRPGNGRSRPSRSAPRSRFSCTRTW